jgi:hypothetical protein
MLGLGRYRKPYEAFLEEIDPEITHLDPGDGTGECGLEFLNIHRLPPSLVFHVRSKAEDDKQ